MKAVSASVVSARNTPEEYEVFYAIEYSVANGGGELIPPQKLELTRDYSYDETAVLAKQREQAILRGPRARSGEICAQAGVVVDGALRNTPTLVDGCIRPSSRRTFGCNEFTVR